MIQDTLDNTARPFLIIENASNKIARRFLGISVASVTMANNSEISIKPYKLNNYTRNRNQLMSLNHNKIINRFL